MNQINIKTSGMELTPALRQYVEEKVGHLRRFAADQPINIDVELEHMPAHHSGPVFRCEVMFDLPGEKQMLRVESIEVDMYAAIDLAVPKMKEQLTKESDKKETKIKKGGRRLKEIMQRFWE